MNYCASPEDKWLLVDLLNNTTRHDTEPYSSRYQL